MVFFHLATHMTPGTAYGSVRGHISALQTLAYLQAPDRAPGQMNSYRRRLHMLLQRLVRRLLGGSLRWLVARLAYEQRFENVFAIFFTKTFSTEEP